MREFGIILIVILVLLGLTAIRYRRQISMMIGIGRALKRARSNMGQGAEIGGATVRSAQDLSKCAGCDTFVPRSRMISKKGRQYCSSECLERSAVS